VKHALGNGVHHLVDLPRDLRQLALIGLTVRSDRSGQLIKLCLIGADVFRDEVRVQQLVLEAGQDAGLEFLALDRQAVAAGPLVPGVGAAVVLLADLNKAAAAGPALQHACEQVGGPLHAPHGENPSAKVCHGSDGIVLLRAEENFATLALSGDMDSGGIFSLELYRKVRLARRGGMSERAAAVHFCVSRASVKKIMRFSVPPGYRRTAEIKWPKLDGFTGYIDQWLSEDLGRNRKQRHTAKHFLSACGTSTTSAASYMTLMRGQVA